MGSPKKLELQQLTDRLDDRFRIVPIEMGDCPVFLAAAVPLREGITGRLPRLPAGRGLTRVQAAISAAAEAIELLATLAQNHAGDLSLFHVVDGLARMACRDVATGERQDVAAQSVLLDAAQALGEPLTEEADSNGCAAGATWREALDRAVLECIERDAVAIWWYGRQQRDHLALGVLDAAVPRLSWWLGERARRTMLIDVSSDIGVPVVVAASAEPDGSRIALGSAAAPGCVTAAVSAVTEMIQTEAAMVIGDSPENTELHEWLLGGSVHAMPQFRRAGAAELASSKMVTVPLERLSASGFQVFAVDLTLRDDLLYCARAIVPGLCALRRKINPERILNHNSANPRFDGVLSADGFEILEPY